MPQGSRRPAAALIAAAVAAVLALGCGDGDGSPQGVSGDSVETASAGAAEPLSTEESARAYARAVNLRASDLPYAEAQPPEDEEDRKEEAESARRTMRAFERCLGGGVPRFDRPLAAVESPAFESTIAGGFHGFESTVEVMSSTEVATRQNEIYRSLRGQACVEHVFPRLFEEELAETPEIGAIAMRPLPVPLTGLDGSLGYRVTTEITIGGPSPALTSYAPGRPVEGEAIPLFIDFFIFLSGQAEITLTLSAAPRPIPARISRNLLRVLHERAEAHKLPAP